MTTEVANHEERGGTKLHTDARNTQGTPSQEEEENLHYNPATKNGVVIDGMTFPPRQPSGLPWVDHIEEIRVLELRSSDVFICAYPKAGIDICFCQFRTRFKCVNCEKVVSLGPNYR
jgi:hypothetical protein